MKNPYENLYIYYLDHVPAIGPEIQRQKDFLGVWVEADEAFVFFSSPGDAWVDTLLSENPGVRLIEKYEMSGDEWHGDKIEPYFIEDLCVYPPWNPPDSTEHSFLPLLLDPGVVFGTGRHQTTEDCLYLLCRLIKRHKIQTVLDIGTGTGLLALGAAVLGCKAVMACDFNLLAVKTALNNIRLNRAQEKVLAFQARGEEVMSIPCDLLVANIHYDVMQHLIESPHLLKKKWFILSGLLNSEAKKIMTALSGKPVQIVERRCIDGVWNTLLGRVM